MTNSVKGYSLFNDVEDVTLRTRNRAVVMANIFDDNLDPNAKTPTIKGGGATLLLKYFGSISAEEQASVWSKFKEIMTTERGYAYAG